MSFADPYTVTINSVAKDLVRIKWDGYSSEYRLTSATDEFRLNIRNTEYLDKKRNVTIYRHNVELIHEVFPVAPATLSTIRKVYTVIENQKGDTLTDPVLMASGLFTKLIASTNADLVKLMSFQA